MAKRTKEELLTSVKELLGDRNDDTALSFLEDLSDTISDGENIDFKQKYEEQVQANKTLEETWRKKYTERFFSPDASHNDNHNTNPANTNKDNNEPDPEEEALEQAKNVTYDDLFKGEEN